MTGIADKMLLLRAKALAIIACNAEGEIRVIELPFAQAVVGAPL